MLVTQTQIKMPKAGTGMRILHGAVTGFHQAIGCDSVDREVRSDLADPLAMQRINVYPGFPDDAVQQAASSDGDAVRVVILRFPWFGTVLPMVKIGVGLVNFRDQVAAQGHV